MEELEIERVVRSRQRIDEQWEALMRLLCWASFTPSVPLPLFLRTEESVEEEGDDVVGVNNVVRSRHVFDQAAVYVHLPVGNCPRWFECAICLDAKFTHTEFATQHSSLHPVVCKTCLSKLVWCPFCRKWIGNPAMRRISIRVLAPMMRRRLTTSF